jgi:O-antigen/teichoic acid export membrane protein
MLKALGRDVVIYGAGEFVFKFIAFAVFPIYAHVLSVPEFGTWALIAVSTLLLGYFANLGINQAVQRYYFEDTTGEADEPAIVSGGLRQLLFSSTLLVGLAMLLTWLFGAPLRERYGIDPLILTIALAAVVPDQLLQFSLDVLRLHFTPLKFLALSFAKNIVGTLCSLYFLLVLDAGLFGIFLGLLVGSAGALPVGLWLVRRDLTFRTNRKLSRALFAFGFPLTFTSIAHWIYTSLDRWMLAELATAEEVGLYSVAAKYATILTFLLAAFGQAWVPFAIRMSRDDPEYPCFFSRILTLSFYFTAFVGLGIGLFAQEALMLLTPPAYWSAAPILPVIVAGIVLFGTTQVTSLGITLSNRTVLSAIGTWIAAAANFGLNLLLIPAQGALGTALATLLSYALLALLVFVWAQRLRPIPVEWSKVAYCLALVVSTAGISFMDLGAPSAKGFMLKLLVLLLAVAGAFAVGVVDRSIFQHLRPKGAH